MQKRQVAERQLKAFGAEWLGMAVAAALLCAGLRVLGQTPSSTSPQTPLPHFEDVTEKANIHFKHSFGETDLSSILEGAGSGCAWLDYNHDGLMDLYVVNGRYMEGITNHSKPDGADATNHLYRNNGDGTFTDVTAQAGVAGKGYGFGVTAGDYDNDGYQDLYVTGYKTAVLYHNNGNGTFTDVTDAAGVNNSYFGVGAAFVDYDRDGRLDLFVGNYLHFDPNYRQFYSADHYPGPLDYDPEFNRLFHNDGNGKFTDVSKPSGIASQPGRAMGITVGDFDNDGWPDIYVANDTMASFLYRNNHDGTFANIAVTANVAYGQNGEATTSMGPAFGDYDNDGWQDLFVSDAHYHRLFRNPGKPEGTFADTTDEAGVGRVGAQYVAWGEGFFDFDNDGWKDIFIVNGGLAWLVPMESTLLRNNRDGTFTDVSLETGQFFSDKNVSRGACFGDFDNDGYVDAFVTTLGGRGILLHNVPPPGKRNHWLTVKLVGTRSNRDGYGASLEAVAGNLRQYVQAVSGTGYLSQNDPRPHFGLGNRAEVDKLTIHWPSGATQTLEHVKADQILTVTEQADAPPQPAERKAQ
ncbi:MAG TPA: CRTAC1 family protein [Terriglobia bacterium]|nr:CRTAC1 family protein [Terriglobia bacterium]